MTGNSTITVDSDGVGGDTDLTVVLHNVDLSQGFDSGVLTNQAAILQSLIDNDYLIVDQ